RSCARWISWKSGCVEALPTTPSSLRTRTTDRGECDTHLRRSGGGRVQIVCARGAPLSVWIPACAGTTRYLSPATFVAPVEAGVQAVCAHGAPLLPGSRPTPGRQRT